ncbi:hypothetical protein ACQBAT_06215 [Ornithinimicrobium sp. Y1847]|uniref:hypothetical protein n=1 Tax=Ornithinimicrobium sp. Y1847 TaxID=3405419 RepID=UPI003B67FD08
MGDTRVSRATTRLALAVSGLLLLAVIAGILASTRTPSTPEGSPEATVQAYARAIFANDNEAVVAQLSPDTECNPDTLTYWVDSRSRVVLRDSRITGEYARVDIEIVNQDTGMIGSAPSGDRQTIDLERVDGRWVITGEPWPIYYNCEQVNR